MSAIKDYTPLEHAGYAVLMQVGMLATLGWLNFWAGLAAGTMLGVGFFVGREHAQAEKRWKKDWGRMTHFSGFDLRKWDRGSILDLVCPVVSCTLVGWLAVMLRGWL